VKSPSSDSGAPAPVRRITPGYDELGDLFAGADIEFIRLSGDTVGSAEIVTVELPGLGFETGRWSWANLTRGSSSHRHTVFEMVLEPHDTFYHHVRATPGAVYAHGPNSEILDTSPPQTEFVVVSIETEQLEGSAEILDSGEVSVTSGAMSVYSGEAAARFQRLALSLVAAARSAGSAGIPPAVAHRLRDDLIVAALGMMDRSESPAETTLARHLSALEIVTACDDYASARRYRGITSLDLSRVAGYSERRVRAAFKEITGVSPMRFIQSRALHEVRRDLLTVAVPTVTDAALIWGFTELGRFSRKYWSQFGELPSETLKTARRRFGRAPWHLEQLSV